jgi:hypothetical protein
MGFSQIMPQLTKFFSQKIDQIIFFNTSFFSKFNAEFKSFYRSSTLLESVKRENFLSFFKRHMKMRSSRVNNAHETRLKHVEYEGNTRGIRREYAFKTPGIRVEYRFKTFRFKRSYKRSVLNTPFKTKFKMTV